MGTSLNGLTPSVTYEGLIKFGDNSALTSTLKALSDGAGNDTMLEISTTALQIGGSTGMYWDNTNKRLGIGTNTPFAPLTVGSNSSFFSVQSAGTGSDFFYTDINPNLTAGANNQVVSLVRLRDRGRGNTGGFTGTQRLSLLMENTSGGQFPFQLFSETGSMRIGYTTIATPSAIVQIQGSGSTAASTSLLVQNSSGTELIRVNDLGLLQFGGTSTSFPALKRVGAGLELRSADDTINGEPTFTTFNLQIRNLIYGSSALSFGYSGGTTGLRISTDGATSIGVSVTDATASSQLEVRSTTKGFLPPRMTTTQKNAISTPAAGLQVYDTTLNQMSYYNGTNWINF